MRLALLLGRPYQAPPEVGTCTVTVASVVEPYLTATATITVLMGGPGGSGGGGSSSPVNNGVSVDPPMQTVDAGTCPVLNATVLASSDQGVTWAIQGNDARAKVDEPGVFSAHEPVIYSVAAASKANPAVNGTAIIEVKASVHCLANPPTGPDLEGYSVTVLQNGKALLTGGPGHAGDRYRCHQGLSRHPLPVRS